VFEKNHQPTRARETLIPYTILLFIAGGINPYLLVMTCSIYFATVITLRLERRLTLRNAWLAAIPIGAALGALELLGFLKFGGKGVFPASGYRLFSSNLDALINPRPDLLGSSILPPLPLASGYQYEGYGYLGLGAILLVGVGFGYAISRRRLLDSFTSPLILVGIGCFALALSTTPTIGMKSYPLALLAPLNPFLEISRSCGRFIWVPYYILITSAGAAGSKTSASAASEPGERSNK